MVLRNVLDFIVPLLWIAVIFATVAYFWIVGRRQGLLVSLRRLFSLRLLWPTLILVCITFLSASMIFIDPKEVGVVVSLIAKKGIRERPLKSGLHFIVPLAEHVVRYPVVMQSYTMSYRPTEGDKLGDDAIRARTSDGQLVIIDVTALYRIDADLAVLLHVLWQDRYEQDFIRPGLRAFVRNQASRFSVDEINSGNRIAFEAALNDLTKEHCKGSGIQAERVLVRNITFSPEYAVSVEQKMTAKQRIEEAEHKAKQMANIANGEGNRIKIKARAQAEAIVVEAEAQARAHVLKAQAENKALNLIADALAQRDNLLTYRYIDKLSPNIQAMLLPSNAPLILPMPQLEKPAEGETLPAAASSPKPMTVEVGTPVPAGSTVADQLPLPLPDVAEDNKPVAARPFSVAN